MHILIHMLQLFYRPSKFFESMDDLYNKTLLFVLTWIVGVITIADQIDQTVASLKAAKQLTDSMRDYTSQMGMPLDLDHISATIHTLTDSWLNYWAFIILLGLLTAPLIWYLSGWGFNLLINWSGDNNYNKTQGRMIYIYTAMIYCLPRVMILVFDTLFYKDDNSALDTDPKSIGAFIFALLFAILPFWSWVTSYIAVRKTFAVETKKAVFWFIGLPAAWYYFTLWQPLFS